MSSHLPTEMLDYLSDALVVTDAAGNVSFWNHAAEGLFGQVQNRAVARPVWDLCPPEIRPELHSFFLDRDTAREATGEARCLLPGNRMGLISWTLRRSGHDLPELAGVWLFCREKPLPPELTDDEKDAAPRLESIVNSINDSIISVDEEFRIVFLNDCAEQTFGCKRESAEGQHIDLFPNLSCALKQLNLGMFKTESTIDKSALQLQGRRANGETFPMEATVAAVEINGHQYFTAVIRDISEQVQIEQALYQAQKTQAIGALANGVAHDFNNILTAILSHLDLVAYAPELPSSLQESVFHAQNSARRGAELVSKLLTFSRNSQFKLATINFDNLVEEVLMMLRRSINPLIQVQHTSGPQGIWPVKADTSQMMQVLMNLCLNARDAMPNGGTLTIQLNNTTFSPESVKAPRRAGDFVCLSVADTGEGMQPEVLNRLGEPYFTTKQFGKGTGLGLSIAYSVVAEHHGWVEVESSPGVGTRFHVYLPRAKDTLEPRRISDSAPADVPNASLEGNETILIVDDDELVRWIVRAVLTYRGYKVMEAINGEDGVQKYQQAETPVDLVLLDLYMPRANGWDALAALKRINPQVSVILLSGGGTEGDKEKALQMGATDFFPKPFENQALLQLVRATLDDSKAQRGRAASGSAIIP